MSSREIEDATAEIRSHIVDFLDTLDERMKDPRLGEIIEEGKTLRSENLGQRPERCVEDALIWPILETLGFEVTPRPHYPYGDTDECPDFRIDNLAEVVIGENKSSNRFDEAKADIETYLDSRRYEYGIATDGFTWALFSVETNDSGRARLVEVIDEQSLALAVRRLARDRGLVNYTEELHSEATVEGILGGFYQTFNHYGVRRTIGGLSEFYDLYLEVISGEGEYQSLATNLTESLDAPGAATASEELAFAALFIDRLAFFQLLLDRGILDGIELHTQWNEHNQGLNRFRGSFYSQYLKPLFYDALSVPIRERADDIPEPFEGVPHLAGGLFAQLLPDERAYDIPDDAMRLILARFVEGEYRTLINEAAGGSLLETYTEEYESRDIAGRIPRYYSPIIDAYAAEVDHVESQIARTLRSFERPE